jgi:hypothetical protein
LAIDAAPRDRRSTIPAQRPPAGTDSATTLTEGQHRDRSHLYLGSNGRIR